MTKKRRRRTTRRRRHVALALAFGIAVLVLAVGAIQYRDTRADSVDVHVVQPGESLSQIAARAGTSVEALVALNDIEDPDRVEVGSRLVLRRAGNAAGDAHAGALPRPSLRVVDAVDKSADAYDLDPYLLLGLAYMESGWQMTAVSHVGAVGAMQLMPETAAWAIKDLQLGRADWRRSLADNVRVGAAYLDYLLSLSDGDVRMALAAYYQGWTSVSSDGMLRETQDYVDDVLALTERFRDERPRIF